MNILGIIEANLFKDKVDLLIMEIIYTAHAEEQLQERKIEKAWVEDTVQFPDVTQHEGHKYYVIKRLNGKTLKVVYVKEKYIKIITSHFVK